MAMFEGFSTRTVAAFTWPNARRCTQPVSRPTVARRGPTAAVRRGTRSGRPSRGVSRSMAARRVDKLYTTARLVEDAGRRALTVATDVTDPSQCQAMVDAARTEFGHVDVLVNNAGVGTAVPARSG